MMSRILAASIGTQGTMGGLIIAGFVSIQRFMMLNVFVIVLFFLRF